MTLAAEPLTYRYCGCGWVSSRCSQLRQYESRGDDVDIAIASELIKRSQLNEDITQEMRRALIMKARAIKEALSDETSVAVDLTPEGIDWSGAFDRQALTEVAGSLVEETVRITGRRFVMRRWIWMILPMWSW